MNKVKSYAIEIDKDGYYDVYLIVYGSELDYIWYAKFREMNDVENYTNGDF